VNIQEDDYPDDSDEQHREDEDEPPLVIIGGGSDDHTQRECGDPGGNRVELGLDGTVTEGSEDGGGELGVAISRNDKSKVHETAEDDLEILEDTENIPPGRVNIKLRIADILSEPGLDKGLFVIGQPLGLLREISDEEKDDNGTSDGHETL